MSARLDQHGYLRHETGAPASTGGRFAAAQQRAAATTLSIVGSDYHELACAAGEAVSAVGCESRANAEQGIIDAFPDATGYRYRFVDVGEYGSEDANVYLEQVLDADGVDLLSSAKEDTRTAVSESFSVSGAGWASVGGADDDDEHSVTFHAFEDDWQPSDDERASDRIDVAARRTHQAAVEIERALSERAAEHGVTIGRVTLAEYDPADAGRNRLDIDTIEDIDGQLLYRWSTGADDDLAGDLEQVLESSNDGFGGTYRQAARILLAAQTTGAAGFLAERAPLDMTDFRFRTQRGYDGQTLTGFDSILTDPPTS